jgi:peptidyl-prolyl cis-trans isomerase SurA
MLLVFLHVFNHSTVRISLIILMLIAAGQAWGQASTRDSKSLTLFLVNNQPVSTEEFVYLYKKNHLKQDDFNEKKVSDYLDLLINFKLKVTEAKARGLDTTAAFVKEFKSYKDELRKPYVGDQNELDRLTREAYQRLTEEVKASHILVNVGPGDTAIDTAKAFNKIYRMRERIMGGENFEKVARAESEDPSAKMNGGSLGYFTVLQMVYPFEQAAYSLKVGEISQPVRTRFGYHLIKVTDRIPARGEVEVSHIILRTGQADNIKVKNKIFEIHDQLRGGRNWDELCKEYSDDPATKNSGGRLRPFGVGALAGVPEFEAVAFSLKTPGEISDPFQSVYGWHIVRLEKKLPVPPYQQVEAALKRKVSRDERLQIADAKLLKAKEQEYQFSEDAELKKWFMDAADSSLQMGKWKFKGDEALKEKTLFTLEEHKFLAADFISFIRTNQTVTNEAPASRMTKLYDDFVKEKISDIQDEKLLKTNPEYRNLLTEYREGILLFTIMEKEVWLKSSEDTVGLKKYYEQNMQKYRAGDRVHARVFASGEKNFRDEILQKVSRGDSLTKDDLKKFKSTFPLRNYEKGDNKAVDLASWSIGLHSVDVDETYYLVEIDKLLAPGIKNFEEVRPRAISDYQDTLEKQWITALKKKYPIKVNAKGKKFVINELTTGEKLR